MSNSINIRRSSHTQRSFHKTLILVLLGLLIASAGWTSEPSTWTKKSFDVKGTWMIVEEGGQQFFVLSDDFKTKSAPDLKIFLSKKSVKEAGNRNATDGSLLVGELPRSKGAVRLAIPAGTDLSEYTTVLLHCEQYSKLWAASALR